MQLKNRTVNFILLIIISLVFMSWGYNGHRIISGNANLSFTPEMEQFQAWAMILAEHASDADYRKAIDPDEGPRHYLDIDNYEEFISLGRIPQTYDSVVALYGEAFVIGQGVLPWATKNTYDSLVSSFARFDWEKAVLFASDLGHYIADGHMPLHITKNYNGQYSGNYGIHSRYESTMINAYQSQISYSGFDISYITDVQDYIFNYLYENYTYVDSVLIADDYAHALAGNTSSSTYKAALWDKTGNFTINLFSHASHALAELIYSAWTEAGKPDMNSGPGIFERKKKDDYLQIHISPNPAIESVKIRFTLPEESLICLKVFDISGAIVITGPQKEIPAGAHEFSFNMADLPEGVYIVSINYGDLTGFGKLVKVSY